MLTVNVNNVIFNDLKQIKMDKEKAINIINSIEPNGELLTTEQVIECMEIAQEQVKNNDLLHNVSKQRELLIAYEMKLWINPTSIMIKATELLVDNYLSNL